MSAATLCIECGKRIADRNMQIALERARTRLRVAALSVAEQHVAEGDARLGQQHEFLDRLRQGGHDLGLALRILHRLEATQRSHLADRARLIGELFPDG